MSNYTHTADEITIEVGFEKSRDYIFVQVIKGNDYLYSNLDDRDINYLNQIDFTYFDEKLKSLSIEIPEKLKIKTLQDRAKYLDSLDPMLGQIKAGYNPDLVSEDDRKFGIEIGKELPGYDWSLNIEEYEYFHTESEALTRVNLINGAFIDDWDDLE